MRGTRRDSHLVPLPASLQGRQRGALIEYHAEAEQKGNPSGSEDVTKCDAQTGQPGRVAIVGLGCGPGYGPVHSEVQVPFVRRAVPAIGPGCPPGPAPRRPPPLPHRRSGTRLQTWPGADHRPRTNPRSRRRTPPVQRPRRRRRRHTSTAALTNRRIDKLKGCWVAGARSAHSGGLKAPAALCLSSFCNLSAVGRAGLPHRPPQGPRRPLRGPPSPSPGRESAPGADPPSRW